MTETTELRWFEHIPRCRCGRKADGILRGSRNESFGHHCESCATRRLKASERERERLAEATTQ
jgi:hypothetical protein